MQTSENNFVHQFDWNLLKTFEEIVRAGGISRAALEWHRKQPAMSLALKRLEQRVGARLCHRGPGGFELTDEGTLVADVCANLARMVAALPERVSSVSEEVRGRVRVQVISHLVDRTLDDALAAFHARYPNVELDVHVGTWEVVNRAIRHGDIDVGIAPTHFKEEGLTYDFLFCETHRPYCGRSHHLFGKRNCELAALAEEAFILTGTDEPDELTAFRLLHGLGRRVVGVSEHLEEAKRLAELGVGVCFLPEGFAAPSVEAGELWTLGPDDDVPAMDIYVLTNPGATHSVAALRFIDELGSRLPSEH